MKASNVVPLRTESQVCLAVSSAEEALQGCLDGKMVGQKASLVVEMFLEIVKSISFGQDESRVNEAILTLVTGINDLADPSKAPSPAVSADAVEKEIVRRQRKRDEVTRIQEHLENERDLKVERRGIVRQMLDNEIFEGEPGENFIAEDLELEKSISFLEQKISLIVSAVAKSDKAVSDLIVYQTAVKVVEAGLPGGLVDGNLDITL